MIYLAEITTAGAIALSAFGIVIWWTTGGVWHIEEKERDLRTRDKMLLIFVGLLLVLAAGVAIGAGR